MCIRCVGVFVDTNGSFLVGNVEYVAVVSVY